MIDEPTEFRNRQVCGTKFPETQFLYRTFNTGDAVCQSAKVKIWKVPMQAFRSVSESLSSASVLALERLVSES